MTTSDRGKALVDLLNRQHEAMLDGTFVMLENSETKKSPDGVWLWVHSPDLCAGRACTVHNRTDHHMRGWRQHWRDDRGIMERICPDRGVGHPDPDSPWPPGSYEWIHGCDGCCSA